MGKLNDITFIKTNGGMGRTAASEDPITGLVMYLPDMEDTDLVNGTSMRHFDEIEAADGTNSLYVAKLRCKEELNDYGLKETELKTKMDDYTGTSDSDKLDAFRKVAAINALVYHATRFFDMNEAGTLYLAVKVASESHITGADLKALQNYTNGAIRQCGVFTPGFEETTSGGNTTISSTMEALIGEYQTACAGDDSLEEDHKPMSVVMTVSGKSVEVSKGSEDSDPSITVTPTDVTSHTLAYFAGTDNHKAAGRCNVSLLIGCDLDSGLVQKLGQYGYYGCIGTCMGAISKAAVNECIAWVQKFPLGLTAPGLISGELIKNVTTAHQNAINSNRYMFVRTHVGIADNYFNDSHTLDVETSDYAYIENVRTIDKACRGVRTNLLPYLNSPLNIDPTTGQLDRNTVAYLETVAGKALEEMEKAGELSGYVAEIDPAQNVLNTGVLKVIIKNVPTGVMRQVQVQIGFVTSL